MLQFALKKTLRGTRETSQSNIIVPQHVNEIIFQSFFFLNELSQGAVIHVNFIWHSTELAI